ncbi:MAG: hypothetical protein CME04_14250 [Gemmatimonadaceae bacterium]|nr:hypothetical protein [Gemmatimonadaceae bacterium]
MVQIPGMTDHPRRIIWFCATSTIAQRPETLVRLRDEIGLTTIMPESPVCHTSGFRASDGMAARGPFEDWRQRTDRWPKAADGIYPPVAGVVGGFDDSELRCAIDQAHEAGIEVWGHIGLWSYGGDVFPEFAMRDVDGAQLDHRWKSWGIGLCPSQPQVNDWTADGLAEITASYDVDGFCVDHARYPQPANLHALIACACEHCCAAGEDLGFDSQRLVTVARATRDAARRIDAAVVSRALDSDLRGPDLLPALGVPAEFLQWLSMRAALLAARMTEFRARVHDVRTGLPFGSDVFAPSIALAGGHDLPRWEEATDFLTGGSSAGGVVGWATASTNVAASWARALVDEAGEPLKVREEDAVELVLRLLSQEDGVALPHDEESLQSADLPLAQLYDGEVTRLVAETEGRVPLYPPISAGGPPDLVRGLGAAVRIHDCHGAMVTVDPDNGESLQALRDGLGGLSVA